MEMYQALLLFIILSITVIFLYIRKSMWKRKYHQITQELGGKKYLENENERLRSVNEERQLAYLEAQKELERKQAFYQAQQEKINEQKLELDRMRTQFNKEFELIASKILEEKTEKFTALNNRNLDQILHPF